MKKKSSHIPDSNEGVADASSLEEQADALPSDESVEFSPITLDTPLGTPIRVRGENCPEQVAIRSRIVGWYAPNFSHPIFIEPTEWADL